MKQIFTSNKQIKLGDIAPNCKVVNNEIKDVVLNDFEAKWKVIITVPSIDTEVCDIQSKTFSKKIANHPDIELILISLDLPFAQKRWCNGNGISNIKMFSDYKYNDFSEKFGLKLKNLGLIGRAVIILDQKNVVKYLDICKNVAEHPNYEKAFEFLAIN